MSQTPTDKADILRLLREIAPLVDALHEDGPWALGWSPDAAAVEGEPGAGPALLIAFREALADIQ